MMPPMSTPEAELHALRARLLRAAGRDLPLAMTSTRGEPLRRVLRDADAAERTWLVGAWARAIERLHRAGFGTDGIIAAAKVVEPRDVRFDPERVFPLGTLSDVARPVAAWLDIDEARRWLGEAGSQALATRTWPDVGPAWRADGEARILAVLGPVDETLAIATALGIDAAPADMLHDGDDAAARRLWQSLALGTPFVVAASDTTALARARCVAERVVVLTHSGGAVALDAAARERLGMAPERSDGASADPAIRNMELQRAWEDADLVEGPLERQRLRAQLLQPLIARHRGAEPLRRRALDAAVDLARGSGDRAALVRMLVRRLEAVMGDDAAQALADATEARRLAGAMRDGALMLETAAWECLVGLLESARPRAAREHLPSAESLHLQRYLPLPTLALALLARWLVDAAEGGAGLPVARALTLARLAGADGAFSATVEIATLTAIARGAELTCEQALTRVAGGLEGALRPSLESCAALLAARRGARVTATDRVVRVAESARLCGRVAAIAALAASATGLEALARALGERVRGDDLPAAVLNGMAPSIEAPTGWWTLFAEALVTRREAEARRHLPLLVDRAARWLASDGSTPGDDAPTGLLAAVGTLLATLDDARARPLLMQALAAADKADASEWLQLRILSGLALVLPAESDEAHAIAARQAEITARRPDIGSGVPDPAPALSPQEAGDQVVGALRDVARAVAKVAPDEADTTGDGGADDARWLAALEVLLGPIVSGRPPAGQIARQCREAALTLYEDADRSVVVTSDAGVDAGRIPMRFRGPARLPAPSIGNLLAAIAPLVEVHAHSTITAPPTIADEVAATPWQRDAVALDDGLVSGRLRFFDEVVRAFAGHRLPADVVRAALRRALSRHHGLYRAVADAWHIDAYRRWMDFLRRNGCLEDFRPFRRGAARPR
jgi:hypothetical protein